MAYFTKHNIQSITLQGNKLVIEHQQNKKEIKNADNPTLQLIQSYCQEQGINVLTLEDLQKTNAEKPVNWTPYLIGGGVVLVIIIGAIIYSITRKQAKISEDEKE